MVEIVRLVRYQVWKAKGGKMSYEERQALAREIAEHVRESLHQNGICPLGLQPDEMDGIRLLGKIAKTGTTAAVTSGVGVITLGVLTILIMGFVGWIKSKI